MKGIYFQKKGIILAKQLLHSVKHVLELFAEMVTFAVFLRRNACLDQLTYKASIEDLPFEREDLFGTNTDAVLWNMDKNIKSFMNIGHHFVLMAIQDQIVAPILI